VKTALFSETRLIEGVLVQKPPQHEDGRGWLMEFFRSDELDPVNFPAMGYISHTHHGVSRGPHEHLDQIDYFFFAGPGDFLLVLWDNRETSSTYRKRMTLLVGENNRQIVIVPPRVVHAYHCISKTGGIVINVPNRLYKGKNKSSEVDEIRHESDSNSPFVADLSAIIEKQCL